MKDEKQLQSGAKQTPDLQPQIYASPDDLPEGLRAFVPEGQEASLTWFKHPFFVGFFPLACPCAIEELISFREERAERLLQAGNVSMHIFAHERAFRLWRLLELLQEGYFEPGSSVKDASKVYWKALAGAWIDAEMDEDHPIWSELLEARVPDRETMTKSKDWAKLDALGDQITVYRGVHVKTKDLAWDNAFSGLQWTLSEKTAEFFAGRFLKAPDQGFVLTAKVPRDKVIAYLTGRGEEEILIQPDHVPAETVTIKPA